MDISTNEVALRNIAKHIKRYNEAQLQLIDDYLNAIIRENCNWDDAAYQSLLDAVRQQAEKVNRLVEEISDFPPYLEQLAYLIEIRKKRGGVL